VYDQAETLFLVCDHNRFKEDALGLWCILFKDKYSIRMLLIKIKKKHSCMTYFYFHVYYKVTGLKTGTGNRVATVIISC